MQSKDFCYFLKGFLSDKLSLSDDNIKIIQEQLSSVFQHDIDPSFPSEFTNTLNQIHSSPELPNFLIKC